MYIKLSNPHKSIFEYYNKITKIIHHLNIKFKLQMSKTSNCIIFWFQYELGRYKKNLMIYFLSFASKIKLLIYVFLTKKYCDYILLLIYFNWYSNNS